MGPAFLGAVELQSEGRMEYLEIASLYGVVVALVWAVSVAVKR